MRYPRIDHHHIPHVRIMPWEALEACQCTRQPGRTLYLNTIAALHNGLAVPWLDSRPIGMPSERMKPTYVILWLKAGTVGSLEKLMLAQCQVLAQPLRLCPPVGCDLGVDITLELAASFEKAFVACPI